MPRLSPRILAAMVLVGAAMSAAAEEPEGQAGKVNANVVRLRAGHGTQFTIVGRVSLGQEVKVLGEKEGWYMVPFPAERWCWIAKRYVRKGDGAMGIVTANNVRIRAAGDMRSVVVAARNAGDRLSIVGEAGDWYKVSPPREARAWIYKEYVDIAGEKVEAGGPDEIAAAVEGEAGEAAEGATDNISDEPLGAIKGVGGVGVPWPEGYRTKAEPEGAEKKEEALVEVPGVDLAGMSSKEMLATAEGLYRSGLDEKNSEELVKAGMIFARLANDYFSENDTRTFARERLRAIVLKATPSEQRELIAFETKSLHDELERIKSHYSKEIDKVKIPPRRRRYTAIGRVEELPRARSRPGDFRLIVGTTPYYYLKSRTVDLKPFAKKKVGIMGRVEPSPVGWSYKVLEVVEIEELPELEE